MPQEIIKGITEELYDCTASNGVSSHTGSVGLKGACTFLLSLGSHVHLSMCVCMFMYYMLMINNISVCV